MERMKSYEQLVAENEELVWRLEEARDTIEAIRTGQVDALVVKTGESHQLYTLKSADQTYRVFIERMSQGAITVNELGFILYSNSRFANMVHCPLDKVIGEIFVSFVAAKSKKRYQLLAETGWEKDTADEIFIKDSLGKLTCCLCSCTSLEIDGGKALSFILTDLTTQKESQKQLLIQNEKLEAAQNLTIKQNDELEATVKERTRDLSISREHFRLLADHITQMTWTNQPDGEVSYFNERWYQYTGLTLEETKEGGWKTVLHPDDQEETVSKYNASLQTGEVFEMENRYRRKDGLY
ncbi:MAG TPA: PAS domain-containing protein, partial [Mucilaginibacter sp.]|nr:PAS domain-containing protein [Mucilaginibacter sp.]